MSISHFQKRIHDWMQACFGCQIAEDTVERNHRFIEEANELVQSCGMTRSEAHQLVDYTWDRPVGVKHQEVGGTLVTLAALCNAQAIDMEFCGNLEANRIESPEIMDKIRAKQAAKPKHSPLAETAPRNEALSSLLVDHSQAASARDVDACLLARDKIYAMFAGVPAWQTGMPPVPAGKVREFIVAVRRAPYRNQPSKVFVFSANYANNYTDDDNLHDRDGESFNADGWYHEAFDLSGEFDQVYQKVCEEGSGDEVIGWQELPKWTAS